MVIVFVVTLVAVFMLNAANDAETSIVIASVRRACSDYSLEVNSSRYCTGITYFKNSTYFTASPRVYDKQGNRVPNPGAEFNSMALRKIKGGITGNETWACSNCADCIIGKYSYCINASKG